MKTQYDPEQFVAAWNSEEFARNLRDLPAGYDQWNSPLTKAPGNLIEAADIPEDAKHFLHTAGLPTAFLGYHFHTLEKGVPPVPTERPDAINNGIELPAIRYGMYSKIGESRYGDDDICVMKYRGHVFWLDYGRRTFQLNGRYASSGGGFSKPVTYPVLDGENPVGPSFIASSVPQLAYLLLTFRDMFVGEGIIGRMADTHPGRLANKMRTALAKIDPAAVYGWDAGWSWKLQTIKDQMF